MLWPCNSYQLRGPTLSPLLSQSHWLSTLSLKTTTACEHSAFPSHPYLILLHVCQPLYPQRLRKSPSGRHLAESSQQTAACLSEGPRAVCVSASSTLRIVPYCICCAQLAVHQGPDGKQKKSLVQHNDEAKQIVPLLLPQITIISHPVLLCLIIQSYHCYHRYWSSLFYGFLRYIEQKSLITVEERKTSEGQFGKTQELKFRDGLGVACDRRTLVEGRGWVHASCGASEHGDL